MGHVTGGILHTRTGLCLSGSAASCVYIPQKRRIYKVAAEMSPQLRLCSVSPPPADTLHIYTPLYLRDPSLDAAFTSGAAAPLFITVYFVPVNSK
ncbi:hypothetical protein GDO78_018230 [Eleutherodactylus coqui]|uniref:Uncharacterized protein n=1 Tax=Eleutherodactylus coqui TaxID=57060 RepID=A0A8J6BDK8_ELECQ|nr:hypothetical protein GDO78_018230 [Eleutherodactylus coqui]